MIQLVKLNSWQAQSLKKYWSLYNSNNWSAQVYFQKHLILTNFENRSILEENDWSQKPDLKTYVSLDLSLCKTNKQKNNQLTYQKKKKKKQTTKPQATKSKRTNPEN